MDSSIDLQQPILDGGIRSINFFNGRLLSARDLTREQSAYREADRRLGHTIGEGIACGLEVSRSQSLQSTTEFPLITINAGLAINRRGQTLMLTNNTDISLVRVAEPGNGAVKSFSDCLPLQTGTYVAGAGMYLLTLAPAQGTEGRALTNGLDTGGASCNTDTLVSAIQCRLIQLDPQIPPAALQDQNHLRNFIAYKCFGTSEQTSFVSDPFGAVVTQYGLLDSLRPNLLTECDVPLAVLYWTLTEGIKFIDMWPVRRRLIAPAASKRWLPLISDRAAGEGEAMFLQFQDHVEDLRINEPSLDTLAASSRFRYLPPVGMLPLKHGGAKGVDVDAFFQGVVHREPEYIDGALLGALISEAANYDPIDLTSGEMVWVYSVWQNDKAVSEKATVQPYLVFTSAHVPYAALARFDVSHWGYANFASGDTGEV